MKLGTERCDLLISIDFRANPSFSPLAPRAVQRLQVRKLEITKSNQSFVLEIETFCQH